MNKTPPPIDRQIIIDVGYGQLHIAIYNPVDEKFVYANMQANLYNGEFNDYYYENEYCTVEEVRGWYEVYDREGFIASKIKY